MSRAARMESAEVLEVVDDFVIFEHKCDGWLVGVLAVVRLGWLWRQCDGCGGSVMAAARVGRLLQDRGKCDGGGDCVMAAARV